MAGELENPEAGDVQPDPIYTTDGLANEFRQGEILSSLTQYHYAPASEELSLTATPYLVLASQDCDLLRDYDQRQAGNAGALNQIFAFEAELAADALAQVKGNDIRKRIKNNKDERYHVLEEVPAALDLLGQGIPALLVDFRAYITVPPDQLRQQCDGLTEARRRTRLLSPYREHFQARAAAYLARIGLPRDHQV